MRETVNQRTAESTRIVVRLAVFLKLERLWL
jgi:hypothetical protein